MGWWYLALTKIHAVCTCTLYLVHSGRHILVFCATLHVVVVVIHVHVWTTGMLLWRLLLCQFSCVNFVSKLRKHTASWFLWCVMYIVYQPKVVTMLQHQLSKTLFLCLSQCSPFTELNKYAYPIVLVVVWEHETFDILLADQILCIPIVRYMNVHLPILLCCGT